MNAIVDNEVRLIVDIPYLDSDEEAHWRMRMYCFSAVRQGSRIREVSGRIRRAVMMCAWPLSKCVVTYMLTAEFS
jgi:hypothetical protein